MDRQQSFGSQWFDSMHCSLRLHLFISDSLEVLIAETGNIYVLEFCYTKSKQSWNPFSSESSNYLLIKTSWKSYKAIPERQ